jgi:hypothetical protein
VQKHTRVIDLYIAGVCWDTDVRRISRCLRKLAGLPDDLIGLEEERRGDGEAEDLSGLEIDDQLELRGLLHRQVKGLDPL